MDETARKILKLQRKAMITHGFDNGMKLAKEESELWANVKKCPCCAGLGFVGKSEGS